MNMIQTGHGDFGGVLAQDSGSNLGIHVGVMQYMPIKDHIKEHAAGSAEMDVVN